jgi:hypothetical protein
MSTPARDRPGDRVPQESQQAREGQPEDDDSESKSLPAAGKPERLLRLGALHPMPMGLLPLRHADDPLGKPGMHLLVAQQLLRARQRAAVLHVLDLDATDLERELLLPGYDRWRLTVREVGQALRRDRGERHPPVLRPLPVPSDFGVALPAAFATSLPTARQSSPTLRPVVRPEAAFLTERAVPRPLRSTSEPAPASNARFMLTGALLSY